MAAPVSEAEIARGMQGCWTWTDTTLGASSQMCLDGGLSGAVTVLDCSTHNDLTECSSAEGRYAFKDEKLWRDFDGLLTNCDVQLEPRRQVALRNCAWVNSTSVAEPIDDLVYQRAVGQ
ncbi:hypothetical protein [Devosia sp.]|uniref:hypothetical protein n=1 Tax=Devosia sp. TaxID=1871048 RepID=UPI0032653225